jgi:putative phosphoribosyl transferase
MAGGPGAGLPDERPAPTAVQISFPPFTLAGVWTLPEGARSVVLLCDGSGSSRASGADQLVARALVEAGIGALLVDLLAAEEEPPRHPRRAQRPDVDLMASRLVVATDWVERDPRGAGLAIGYFSHGTGAAAALVAAAARAGVVRAVVCAGGRFNLAAGSATLGLRAPTLLITGGRSRREVALERQVLERLPAPDKAIEVIPAVRDPLGDRAAASATSQLATRWFQRFLGG